MIDREILSDYLDDFLKVSLFDDYTINGLQVEGKQKIQHIVSGVTASEALIQEAISLEACALLVHHGYFWRGEDPSITGIKKKRYRALLFKDINLFAYHLPLDCHPLVGNNAKLGELLDIQSVQSIPVGKIPNLLWHGCLKKVSTPKTLMQQCQKVLKQKPLYLPSGTQKSIETIAWCTGGAERYIQEAKDLGVDAYMTGEYSEQTMHLARELDIHFFGCGHHATERYGVQALGEHLATQFDIKHTFVDIPNPV